MSRFVGIGPLASPPLIGPSSRLSCGGGAIARNTFGTPATGVSPWSAAANVLFAFPFVLEAPTVFYKGFWVNGSSAGGNTEVGIWDDAYNKIVTTGSIANVTNSVPQAAALTATTTLPPGRYYCGIAHNATTTQHFERWSLAAASIQWKALGFWSQGSITLGSLAATATPAAYSTISFPNCGLITRSVFDL